MTAHDWKLTRTNLSPDSSAGFTEFTWRCTSCQTEVETKAPSHVGSEGAAHYKPGARALQHNAVLEDCDDALVNSVHDL